MYNNHSNGASYGFKAPSIAADAGKHIEVPFPTFEKVTPTVSSNAATVDIARTTTMIDFGNSELANATNLTLKDDANLPAGARCLVKWKNPSTKVDVTVKKGSTTVATLTGVNSKVTSYELVWDGETWILLN